MAQDRSPSVGSISLHGAVVLGPQRLNFLLHFSLRLAETRHRFFPMQTCRSHIAYSQQHNPRSQGEDHDPKQGVPIRMLLWRKESRQNGIAERQQRADECQQPRHLRATHELLAKIGEVVGADFSIVGSRLPALAMSEEQHRSQTNQAPPRDKCGHWAIRQIGSGDEQGNVIKAAGLSVDDVTSRTNARPVLHVACYCSANRLFNCDSLSRDTDLAQASTCSQVHPRSAPIFFKVSL